MTPSVLELTGRKLATGTMPLVTLTKPWSTIRGTALNTTKRRTRNKQSILSDKLNSFHLHSPFIKSLQIMIKDLIFDSIFT